MRIVHDPSADGSSADPLTVATDVEFADSVVQQGLGLMFRRSIPDDYGLVFRFDEQRARSLHMVFVPFAIDAVWTTDGVVQGVERLSAWTGFGRAVADTIFEFPAGAADDVRAGDRIYVVE